MTRLTYRNNDSWGLTGLPWEDFETGRVITKDIFGKLYFALAKLRDYEDTGFSPEKLRGLRDADSSQTSFCADCQILWEGDEQ